MAKTPFYRFMCWYDGLWRRWHNVEKHDDLFSYGLEIYKGEHRQMNDGTWLAPGDQLIILHFNRECFINPGTSARDYVRSALHFRKLILASFGLMAKRLQQDEKLREVKALHGVSWLPPHGEKVGFMIERLPDSPLNAFRKFYFRLLLKTFFPVLAARENQRLQAHAYWLTRQNLFNYFSKEARDELEPGPHQSREPRDSEAAQPAELAGYYQ